MLFRSAFSGSYNGSWNIQGFVPPLFDEEKYNQVIQINDKKIHELSEIPEGETEGEKALRNKKRLALGNETLKSLYALYNFTCADGKIRTFANLNLSKLPPTGTGDCCAPKLLSYAYSKNLTPVSLAEFYWGKPNSRFVSKQFYPPCDEKCGLILPTILGLEMIYRDEDIIVVNKPSGLLSVPGRGEDKQDCVVNRVKRLFPSCIEQPSVHRLDMDTSGLLVLAFTTEAQRNLSIQFQTGKVQKSYIAVVDGVLSNEASGITKSQMSGRIELKFRLDVDNRPHQIYDEVYGKLGITLWERLRVWNYNGRNVTSVRFTPLTGRTHQLRLASSDKRGFGMPIIGDNLYGVQHEGERLMLHAATLSFYHPTSGKLMEFSNEPDFNY